jgi:hypothetical protein
VTVALLPIASSTFFQSISWALAAVPIVATAQMANTVIARMMASPLVMARVAPNFAP